jgi:deazaflavin-dependent oxidoreductase (nitroreductase family)
VATHGAAEGIDAEAGGDGHSSGRGRFDGGGFGPSHCSGVISWLRDEVVQAAAMADAWMSQYAAESFCYLTTVGRRTGKSHEIEIWFGVLDGRLYMMAGGRGKADWVRNLMRTPGVSVRINGESRRGTARVLDEEGEPELDARVRRVVAEKYGEVEKGGELSGWAKTALPVEVTFI